VRTRERGTTLLEIMIVVAVLSILLTSAFFLSDTMTKVNNSGSIEQYTQGQCRRVIDFVASDYRQSAAWTYFRYSPPTSTTPTRMTYWDAGTKLTRGGAGPTGGGPFQFGWLNAATDALAFNRIVGATVSTATHQANYPAYLVFDFEPKEPAGYFVQGNNLDIGNNGDVGQIVPNQTGRMDDDPNRYYILYRTVVVRNRVIVQRVSGVSGTGDGATTLNPPFVQDIGDLGPAVCRDGPVAIFPPTVQYPLGGHVDPGYLAISCIDTGDPSGAGAVRVHVVARGQYAERKGSMIDTYTAELMTQIYCYSGAPPY
jgi:prepilin-type N-terminal cleavage/methylation domain-containing protein